MEVDLPAVFIGVHNLVGPALSPDDRECEVEGIIHPPAMCAQYILRDVSLYVLTTFHAVGLFYP